MANCADVEALTLGTEDGAAETCELAPTEGDAAGEAVFAGVIGEFDGWHAANPTKALRLNKGAVRIALRMSTSVTSGLASPRGTVIEKRGKAVPYPSHTYNLD